MPDPKVTALKVVPVDRTGAPQENVIAYLEDMLVRARRGEVQSIITAWVQANGRPAHGMMWGQREQDFFLMGTAMIYAQHDFACEGRSDPLEKPDPTDPEPA